MKYLLLAFLFPFMAFAYPERCMPDHKSEYLAAFGESKTAIDKFWQQGTMACKDAGEFLDYFELKDSSAKFSEKEMCQWAGTTQGIALFSQQREEQCGSKKCTRSGAYVARNVAKSFCGLVELYTSDLSDRFMKDLERPVCAVPQEECVREAEIYSNINCKALKQKYPTAWEAVVKQTCF